MLAGGARLSLVLIILLGGDNGGGGGRVFFGWAELAEQLLIKIALLKA